MIYEFHVPSTQIVCLLAGLLLKTHHDSTHTKAILQEWFDRLSLLEEQQTIAAVKVLCDLYARAHKNQNMHKIYTFSVKALKTLLENIQNHPELLMYIIQIRFSRCIVQGLSALLIGIEKREHPDDGVSRDLVQPGNLVDLHQGDIDALFLTFTKTQA